ncbi:MAG: PIN domain-containing protein [Desulfovermiculus sp.]|nr:PIN domain-containing protein [Desulfovermiculus sp.]
MSVDFFLDTNLFIYQLEFLDEQKGKIAESIITQGIANGNACISFQVIQECLHTIRRKAEIPLAQDETRRYLETVLFPLWRIMPSQKIYLRALSIQDRYGFAFYDSLIVAAALDRGCSRLYSEDLQHGQRIECLVIENPFIE